MARSKRRIALSFVTTVSVASGCQPAQPDAPDGDGTATATSTAPDSVGSTSASPTTTTGVVTAPTASGSVPPTAQPERTRFVAGKIDRDGSKCTFTETRDDTCPPDTDCNPPPPFVTTVECPSPKVKLPASMSIVKQDGGCAYFPPMPPTQCQPHATCNPPPPQRVKIECPPSLRNQ